ncbi:putative serine/threonine-protein kinase PBL17 [Capsicum annuum]
MGEMNGGSGILMLRKKMEEWGLDPYCSQMFNKDEPYDWRPRYYLGDDYLKESLREFLDEVEEYKSFDFSIGTDLDQIEFFTNENANMHPKLAKLCTFCCDTRLAAVCDVEFDDNITRLLSDVILEDFFGWDDRIKVAIQLSQLLAWFCMKREMDIKVFDFGSVSDHMHKGVKVPGKYHSGWEAPERGNMTAKSDVFVFGLLLVELITKKEVDDLFLFPSQRDIKNIVDESFKEVDAETASKITSMTYRCTEMEANDRPTMKEVLNVLEAAAKMGAKGEKRRRSGSSSSEDGSKGGEAKKKLEAAKTNEAIEAATANEEGSRSS